MFKTCPFISFLVINLPGLKLAVTLRLLAIENSYSSLQYSFRVEAITIHKFQVSQWHWLPKFSHFGLLGIPVVSSTPLWLASPTLLLLHNLLHPGSPDLVVLLALEISNRRLQLLSDSGPIGCSWPLRWASPSWNTTEGVLSQARLNSASSLQWY